MNDVRVGPFAFIDRGAFVDTEARVGAFCEIRQGCIVQAGTTLGSRCTLSAYTRVGSGTIIRYGFVACDKPGWGSEEPRPPVIGSNVRIGANVTVMPGVTIGDGATIGACSQVREDVPAGEVWYGNPARRRSPPPVECFPRTEFVATCCRCQSTHRAMWVVTLAEPDQVSMHALEDGLRVRTQSQPSKRFHAGDIVCDECARRVR